MSKNEVSSRPSKATEDFVGTNSTENGNQKKKYVPPYQRRRMIEDFEHNSNSEINNNNNNHYQQETRLKYQEFDSKKNNYNRAYSDDHNRPSNFSLSSSSSDARFSSNYGRSNSNSNSSWGGGGYNNSNQKWNSGGSSSSYYGNRREVYVEDREEDLFKEADDHIGINFEKYNDIPVEASGEDCPKAIQTFDDCDLHDLVVRNIIRAKYKNPTPIQKFSIPVVLKGRDLMGCAQTGSGKTCAFLLPAITLILYNGKAETERKVAYPSLVVLAPTRELAIQIYQESKKFCFKTGLVPQVVYGGDEIRDQIRSLQKGCDVLVATPGRLVDMITRGKVSLAGVRHLVLDEADRMLDMGFEDQIRQIVEKEDLPKQRQTLMFSATFPIEIQKLAGDFLENYIFLTVGKLGSTNSFITQKVEYVEEEEKQELLVGMLKQVEGRTLVFVETKKAADQLEYFLYKSQFRVDSIHGDRTQQERLASLNAFKKGEIMVLVATSVAARGLDIDGVQHVINYDLPTDVESYVHRIGRTGRCGHTGLATSFFTEKNKNIMRDLYKVLVEAEQEVPSWMEKEMSFQNKRDYYGSTGGGNSNYGHHHSSSSSRGGYHSNSRGNDGNSRGVGGHHGGKFGGVDYRKKQYQDQKEENGNSSSQYGNYRW